MRRRTVLASAGTALTVPLSGCLGSIAPGSTADARTVEDIRLDDHPGPLSYDITLQEDRLAEESLPSLDSTVENDGDEPVTLRGIDRADAIFKTNTPSVPDDVLVLQDDVEWLDEHDLWVGESGCRRSDEGAFRVSYLGFGMELEPGETATEQVFMFANSRAIDSQCPPADTYRFETWYPDNEAWDGWGFEFDLV